VALYAALLPNNAQPRPDHCSLAWLLLTNCQLHDTIRIT